MMHKWWKTRARRIIVRALLSDPDIHLDDTKRVADLIMNALEESGLRIVRERPAPQPRLPDPGQVDGWGSFRMPGEQRRWDEAGQRAQVAHHNVAQAMIADIQAAKKRSQLSAVEKYLADDRTLEVMVTAMIQWRKEREGYLFFDGQTTELALFVLDKLQDDRGVPDDRPADQKPDSGAHSAVPPPWEEP